MKILSAMGNPWSSSSKIKTSCERGGKRWRKGMQKSNLAHVGLFDTRGCTCEKVSFIETKRWVTLRYKFLSKRTPKKQQKDRANKKTKKHSILQFVFALEPSKILAPVWEWWRFSEHVIKMMLNLEFSRAPVFYLKTKFVGTHQERMRPTKSCILQIKLDMCIGIAPKLASRKSNRKHTKKRGNTRPGSLKMELLLR